MATRQKKTNSNQHTLVQESALAVEAEAAEEFEAIEATIEEKLLFSRTRHASKTLYRASIGMIITAEQKLGKWFHRQVEKGEHYQQHVEKKHAASKSSTASKSATKSTTAPKPKSIKLKATDKIHDIEHSLEKGRSNTLHWIGVPSRNDMDTLQQQVAQLTKQMTALSKQLKKSESPKATKKH